MFVDVFGYLLLFLFECLFVCDLCCDCWWVVGLYLVLVLVWILCSDVVVQVFVGDMYIVVCWQIFKGVFFVIVSVVLIYLLLCLFVQYVLYIYVLLEGLEVCYCQMFEGNLGLILVYDLVILVILDVNLVVCSLFGWLCDEFMVLLVDVLWLFGQDVVLMDKLVQICDQFEQLCVIIVDLWLKDGS